MGKPTLACPNRKVGKPKYVRGQNLAIPNSAHVVLRGQDLGEPPPQLGRMLHTPTSGGDLLAAHISALGKSMQSPIGAHVDNVG